MYRHLAAVRNICVITWTTTYMYFNYYKDHGDYKTYNPPTFPNKKELSGVFIRNNSCANIPAENPKI